MQQTLLDLSGFGVAFGERTVLSSVTLCVPEHGIVVLLGPAGTGKSTLLRTLAGFNDPNPSLRTWGEARYADFPLGSGERPALVSQSAKLMMSSVLENVVGGLPERRSLSPLQQRELASRLLVDAGLGEYADLLDEPVVRLSSAVQRRIAILRQSAANPKLLCIDEPTTGLSDEDSEVLLDYIHAISARCAILVVLHNQMQARRLGGDVVLLAGGLVQEAQPAEKFFEEPVSAAGREFLRMGTCCVPSPDAAPEELDELAVKPAVKPEVAQRTARSEAFGPRGFLWLKKGVLAGTPRPGVMLDIHYDLLALKRVGITTLLSLTQTAPDAAELNEHGLQCIRSPILDMGAPSLEQAASICVTLDKLIAEGEAVAVHCRAGLGRTGTVLAAYLIWEGASALDALETVRRVEPRWVQSEPQVAFLEEFARSIANTSSAQRAKLAKTPDNGIYTN